MKRTLTIITLLLLMSACIPDNVKEKIVDSVSNMQKMMADMEFKKAIAQIELHKVRNGNYPNSLSELKFLSAMDSSMFSYVEYTRLDAGYELNLAVKLVGLNGKESNLDLQYPPEFWKGLGCVRSNLKRNTTRNNL